jgi:cytochrome c-type biogenesis protein CcmF
LYVGYVGCTVPFAFAAAALLHRRYDGEWLATLRRWTLFPWIVLAIGIIMGGRWAYETLGWGGYWAWDPVENASLMPWLTGTAFLHSIMIQARRGMLKTWNMVLVALTFLLSVFGTFLTRSGVISSVHSFAESNIGGYFLGFLAIALVLSFGLILWRRDDLVADTEFESPISREGAFLLNNWILLGSAFAVLWGTVFPSISEAINGATVSVGPPYFNRVMVPLGLILLALTGIGPLMAWRRMTAQSLLRALRYPLVVGLLMAPLLWALGTWHTGAATAFCLAAFVTFAIGSEFVRGARARHAMTGESVPRGFLNLLLKNKQRYGGYIVHLGIVVLFVGAAGNAFKIETEPIELKPGQTMKVGEYTLLYDGLHQRSDIAPEKEQDIAAKIIPQRNGKPIAFEPDGKPFALYPSIDVFKAEGTSDPEAMAGQAPQTARRPAIMSNAAHDLYLALIEFNMETGTAQIKGYLNPLVMWIWISTIFFIGGTTLSLLPDRRRSKVAKQVVSTVLHAGVLMEHPMHTQPVRPQVAASTAPRASVPREEAV